MHPCARRLRLGSFLWLALALLAPVAAAQVQLVASGGDTSDAFGGGGWLITGTGGPGVAVSGDVAVIGTYGDDLPAQGNQGSATVFRRNGAAWVEGQTLVASGGDANDDFGWSVAICGPVIVVGAPYAEVGGVTEQGTATVFRFNGSSWIEEQTLVASGGDAFDGFGTCVSVSGDVIAVSSTMDDVGGNIDQGSVTVFRFNGTNWVEEQTLVASAGAAFDSFGGALSASGTTIAVGAFLADVGGLQDVGSVTVFRRMGGTWVEEQSLTPAGGAAFDGFGAAVSVSGDVLVGGAPYDQVGGFNGAGSATVYRWNGAIWTEEQTLQAAGGQAFDWFGASVAVSGLGIMVGSVFDDVGGQVNQGSATPFRWDGSAWNAEPVLVAGDGGASDSYGASVAVDGETVLVGSPYHDVGVHGDQGAAYVYELLGGAWSDQGAALAGVFGAPLLAGSGDLSAGAVNVVDLSLAAPGALAGLFLGFSGGAVPFKGGTLKPFPFLPPVFVATSPSGTLSLPLVLPAGVPAGSELWFQWAFQDPEAIFGVALSNALRGLTP